MTEAVQTASEFRAWLQSKDACHEALVWLGDRTAQRAWDECERADWLLWWAARTQVDRKTLVRCACACARRALRFIPEGETRPLQAIETAEAWCERKATIKKVRNAADATYYAAANAADAAADAAYYAAANAAAAAADATYYAAANAAANAADAAYYAATYYAAANAADAAADATYYAADAAEHLAMCTIVRDMIAFPGGAA